MLLDTLPLELQQEIVGELQGLEPNKKDAPAWLGKPLSGQFKHSNDTLVIHSYFYSLSICSRFWRSLCRPTQLKVGDTTATQEAVPKPLAVSHLLWRALQSYNSAGHCSVWSRMSSGQISICRYLARCAMHALHKSNVLTSGCRHRSALFFPIRSRSTKDKTRLRVHQFLYEHSADLAGLPRSINPRQGNIRLCRDLN